MFSNLCRLQRLYRLNLCSTVNQNHCIHISPPKLPHQLRYFSSDAEQNRPTFITLHHAAHPTKFYSLDSNDPIWKTIDPPESQSKPSIPSNLSSSHQHLPFSSYSKSNWRYWLHFLLPEQYPNSVTPGYHVYASWLFLQWVLQSFTYMFSTYALLSSVGVENAIGLSAALNWVLKDGLGCVGMMLSASRLGGTVDLDPKRTKFLSDIGFHLGVALEMLLFFSPQQHHPLLWIVVASVANCLKAMAGLVGGACRTSMNNTFSLRQNLGDITAKSQSQSTLGYLFGMLGGIPLSYYITGEETFKIISAVSLFGFGALYCSSKALAAVALRSINLHRATILIQHFFDASSSSNADKTAAQQTLTPQKVCQVENRTNSLLFSSKKKDTEYFKGALAGSRIQFGSALDEAFQSPHQFDRSCNIFKHEKYLITFVPAAKQTATVHVLFHVDASAEDMIKAFFHCLHLDRFSLSAPSTPDALIDSLSQIQPSFHSFIHQLNLHQWKLDRFHLDYDHQFRIELNSLQ